MCSKSFTPLYKHLKDFFNCLFWLHLVPGQLLTDIKLTFTFLSKKPGLDNCTKFCLCWALMSPNEEHCQAPWPEMVVVVLLEQGAKLGQMTTRVTYFHLQNHSTLTPILPEHQWPENEPLRGSTPSGRSYYPSIHLDPNMECLKSFLSDGKRTQPKFWPGLVDRVHGHGLQILTVGRDRQCLDHMYFKYVFCCCLLVYAVA